jgi:hypothetical protein
MTAATSAVGAYQSNGSQREFGLLTGEVRTRERAYPLGRS